MLKIILAAMLTVTSAFAAEVVVLDEPSAGITNSDRIRGSIYMDLTTGEGFAKVKVTREEMIPTHMGPGYGFPYPGGYYPGHFPGQYPGHYPRVRYTYVTRTLFDELIKVEGLHMVGDKAMFNETECGTMGESRILRVPTLYLNGNCQVVAKSVRVNGKRRLQATFITK